MICIIRIKGRVGLQRDINETLNRLRLMKKYSCVVLNSNNEIMGMVRKLKDYVAFGEIKDGVFEKLIEKRGKALDKSKRIDAKKVVESLKKGEKYEKLNLKPFFRLHPPRKGINSKLHFPKGVLGNHKEKINELIKRML